MQTSNKLLLRCEYIHQRIYHKYFSSEFSKVEVFRSQYKYLLIQNESIPYCPYNLKKFLCFRKFYTRNYELLVNDHSTQNLFL